MPLQASATCLAHIATRATLCAATAAPVEERQLYAQHTHQTTMVVALQWVSFSDANAGRLNVVWMLCAEAPVLTL